MVRELLRDLLEEEGHAVSTAGEGGEGMRLLRDFPADLVITDLLMPGQEGIATIQELQRQRPDIKVVAISGGGTRRGVSFLDLAEKLGAHATLCKPIDADELAETVNRLLSEGEDTAPAQASSFSR